MKKIFAILFTFILVLSGCSQVSKSDFDAIVSERDKIKADFATLSSDNAKLQFDYDTLKEQTADWIKLSDTEKAAQQANAEAEKIKAEEAQKKAEEEQAAANAAKQAELEKQQAAEAAAKLEEEKKGYDTGITYDQLARTPDDYKGQKVKFKGQVVQVIEGNGETDLRIATKPSDYGSYYEDIILVYYDTDLVKSRILEDDIVIIYGISQGIYTYESTMGGDITVPLIKVDRIELK